MRFTIITILWIATITLAVPSVTSTSMDSNDESALFVRFPIGQSSAFGQKDLIIDAVDGNDPSVAIGHYRDAKVIVQCVKDLNAKKPIIKRLHKVFKTFEKAKQLKQDKAYGRQFIAELLHVFPLPNGACSVVPFVDGEPLDVYADRLNIDQKSNWLPFIFEQILNGIAYIHHAKLAHSNIQPKNIIISHSDVAKPPRVIIVDYSFTQTLSYTWNRHTKKQPPSKGEGTSAYYQSPDSFALNVIDLQKFDAWAIGACIYRALAGKAPFSDVIDTTAPKSEQAAAYSAYMRRINSTRVLALYPVTTNEAVKKSWEPLISTMYRLMIIDYTKRPALANDLKS
ncbi:kinase-like domain-containing protein [Syncephalis fuscata]|nr:kinase-like domain-containing protein [Syncephalis fuscata]